MDDNRFDDLVRKKVGEYEAPGFDPAALAGLHHRVDAGTLLPWHARYRTELIVGASMSAVMLILLVSQWYIGHKNTAMLEEEIRALKTQNEQIAILHHEIDHLKRAQPETIRVVEIREQPAPGYGGWRNRAPDHKGAGSMPRFSAGEKNERPPVTINSSAHEEGPGIPEERLYRVAAARRLTPHARTAESARAQAQPDHKAATAPLSAKTLRALERHYRHGLGIRVGPAAELSYGLYARGTGNFNLGGGLMTDLILSPSLSLQTGIKYTKRYYELDAANDLADTPLPGVDESLGRLQKAEIDSWIVEIPAGICYRHPVSLKTHWLAALGYSAMLYWHQDLEYTYEFDNSGSSELTITSDYEAHKPVFSPGMLNISLGISSRLKNKKILETTLYYQHGLGDMGLEKVRASFLGIKGVYWFTLR